MDRCYYLPEHVLLDMLMYLPVMSLLRFKAVCKYWCFLIESPAFISEHIAQNRDSNEEDNFIVLGRHWDPSPSEPKFALLSGGQYEECVYDIDKGMFWYPENVNVSLVGYCDGIVCLKHSCEIETALWNPASKQVRRMPPPLFSDRLLKEESLRYTSFGADLKSNDYKIVSILSVLKEIKGKYRVVDNQVEVYNLRGDDSWRIIYKDDVLPFHEICNFDAVSSSKSGMCFWLASYDKTTILLSFDFSDDVFRTMRLPDDAGFPHIDLLDDKVVCMVEKFVGHARFLDGKTVFLDVWMLREFGVEESWNMIYKVGPFFGWDMYARPRFSKNGDFLICSLMIKSSRRKLYLYNLHTHQGNYIQSCYLQVSAAGTLIRYSPSILSLKKANIVKPTQ